MRKIGWLIALVLLVPATALGMASALLFCIAGSIIDRVNDKRPEGDPWLDEMRASYAGTRSGARP